MVRKKHKNGNKRRPDSKRAVSAGITASRSAIRNILKTDTDPATMETLVSLMGIESRKLPETLTGHHFKLKESANRLCCFDTASKPPAWSAHVICPRCQQLNLLLQTLSKHSFSAIAKSIIGTCFLVTDCASQNQHRGKVIELPTELMDMIVDFVFDDLQSSQDGSVVAALMHTSTMFRLKMANRFEPLVVYECDQPTRRQGPQLRVPRALHGYIWDTLQDYFSDVTIRRHRTHNLETLDAKEEGRELLTTLDGLNGQSVDCTVALTLDELCFPDGEIAHRKLMVSSEHVDHAPATSVNVSDAIEALSCALENLELSFERHERAGHIKYPALLSPLFANLYQRALSAAVRPLLAGALVDIKLTLRDLDGDHSKFLSRTWHFDTLKVRKTS